METKHTPGPWILDIEAGTPGIFGQDAQPICYTGEVRGFVNDFQRDNCEADARLIAAAPELLEVAQSILADDMLQYLPTEYVAKVRAAIAKATGA